MASTIKIGAGVRLGTGPVVPGGGLTLGAGVVSAPFTINFVGVGGGGGGGCAGYYVAGGNGGAGGVALGSFTGTKGVSYTITVGAGGPGSSVLVPGTCGQLAGSGGGSTTMTGSPFGTFFLANGGAGGGAGTYAPPAGPSVPGVAGSPGTPGAAPVGGPGSPTPGGRSSSITGSAVAYGNGCGYGASGRGGGTGGPYGGTGAPGSAGAVILSVPTPNYPGTAPGATVSTPPAAPGKTILLYTTSASYTA